MKPTEVNETDYRCALEENLGWCTHCRAFTVDGVEPDAREYKCYDCDKNTVLGAEEAMMTGAITL